MHKLQRRLYEGQSQIGSLRHSSLRTLPASRLDRIALCCVIGERVGWDLLIFLFRQGAQVLARDMLMSARLTG
jgi:hypothetical protein